MGNACSMGNASSAHIGPTSEIVAPASGLNGATRRSRVYVAKLEATFFPGEVTTCYEGFRRGLRTAPDGHCFGSRAGGTGAFVWQSYSAIAAIVDALGSGIAHLTLAQPNDMGIKVAGIFGKNRWEWSTTQQALWTQSICSVPLYDTLGAAAVAHIVSQTAMTTIFCSRAETGKLIAFKAAEAAAFTTLTNVVQFEDASDAEKAAAAAAGLTLRSFKEVEDAGRLNAREHLPPKPSDYAVICYTSGTTGTPKGAILTHGNMVADACNAFWGNLGISSADVHLSYLPLAHVFEQLVQNALTMVGAAIGFYQGDTLKIMEDISALQPTIFPSVPRLFNRIYDKVLGGVEAAGGVKAALFKKAFADKQHYLRSNVNSHSVWDALVFRPLATRVGLGRCRLMITGSAPLAAHVMEFLRCVFSCQVVEGYGGTECGGACTVTDPLDVASLGHVGAPLASNEIKLLSVPDLGYTVADTVHGEERDAAGAVVKAGVPCEGRGEVCVRGPNVFPGYYKDAANTAEALDADGWLHTGDIGLWDARGHLKIIDRRKNMFKLSQGEYVAAEKVETALQSAWVQQIFVYGDSLHSMLVAIVVPNPDALKAWAREQGRTGAAAEPAALCAEGDVVAAVLADFKARAKEQGLTGFETPRGVHLDAVAWTPEDVLTPTFKLKRKDAQRRYQAQIDAMYARLETVAGRQVKQGE